MRATPLSPSEWRKRLEVVNDADMQSEREDSALNRKFLILDVRNGMFIFLLSDIKYSTKTNRIFLTLNGELESLSAFH